MALAEIAATAYDARAELADRAGRSAADLWHELDPADLRGSWASQRVGERLFVAVSAQQLAAAQSAEPFVITSLAEQGAPVTSGGLVRATALAGIASDGRDLDALLYQPVLSVLGAIAGGVQTKAAVQAGGTALETIARTQVADTARAATGVAMQAHPQATGWVRMLRPPACGRCAVLAGRRYRVDAGFNRHPRCDCTSVPAVEDRADDLRTDPAAYFASLGGRQQERYFGVAGAEAIRAGADVAQVVNARRSAAGLTYAGRLTPEERRAIAGARGVARLQRVDVYGRQVYVTTEGTTRRGLAGRRLSAWSDDAVTAPGERNRRAPIPRLMPEAVYELAQGDRDEAVRLLRRFGYLL